MAQIQSGFIVDGKVFATKSEAVAYIRLPAVTAALLGVASGDQALADFLLQNEDEIQNAFETGTIRRVTKAERKKLQDCANLLKTNDDPKVKFFMENIDGLVESFRWPAVKRLKEDEKNAAVSAALSKLADENFANWVIANQAAVLSAYEAGVEKREVSQKATDGLAAYRAKMAAIKAEKEAAAKAAAPAA